MWNYSILVLSIWCFVAGKVSGANEDPQEKNQIGNNNINIPAVKIDSNDLNGNSVNGNNVHSNNKNTHGLSRQQLLEQMMQIECPAGFFRVRKTCYYLSAGTATWREAQFQCIARNATLAVLDKNGKDKGIRRHLLDDKFRKLERWIGGIFNWKKLHWEWGSSAKKLEFQNFINPESAGSKTLAYHCILLDPNQQYKWNPSSCVSHKHYICEIPGSRIRNRQRKNITDPLAPQNQRLRSPLKKDKNITKTSVRHKNRLKSIKKKNWHRYEDNQIWAHGIKPGSITPKGLTRPMKKQRHHEKKKMHNRKQHLNKKSSAATVGPIMKQDEQTPIPNEVHHHRHQNSAFQGVKMSIDGTNRLDAKEDFHHLFGDGDFTREEVLLKL